MILRYILFDTDAPKPPLVVFSDKPLQDRVRLVDSGSVDITRKIEAWIAEGHN